MEINFIEIDIEQPVQGIPISKEIKSLWILAFFREHPIGWMVVNNQLKSADLEERVLNKFTWQLWQQAISGNLNNIPTDQQSPPISVVVCTRDRRTSLERCLTSLQRQDYPHYEVIVVDNGSQDSSIQNVVSDFSFSYVREDRPGLDWARNRGIQAASYEIIAFIDDDAIASVSWLRGIAQGFVDPKIMVVTGLVLPAELETSAQFDFESYGGMGKGFYRFTIYPSLLTDQQLLWASSCGVGTNMAIRRGLIDFIGDFDVALDVGTPSCGGGDIEFFYRAIQAGFSLRYEPNAWVRHYHRKDRKALFRQIYNNGRSFPNYLLTITRKYPKKRWAVIKFALHDWLWRWLLRRIISSFVRDDPMNLRFALLELLGCISSIPAYWQSQRIASHIKAQGV